ncbi:MAG: hypothetical protein F6K28_25560 [Microcoleus sp. SIO2G3]|nr:hypothetical protein [Microcoleus sp. SIO2G3]
MTTPEERLRIASQILDWEARRDSQGRLRVYKLPPGDGGGTYEVAGINDRYHPVEARRLKELIEQGRYKEAEDYASAYIAAYTNGVVQWTTVTSVEAFLRDSCFNRGFVGAAKIFQIALGVEVDGDVGPITLKAARKSEAQPRKLLQSLREAREKYERTWIGRDESSRFWQGLVNRWNKALKFSLSLLPSSAADNEAFDEDVYSEMQTSIMEEMLADKAELFTINDNEILPTIDEFPQLVEALAQDDELTAKLMAYSPSPEGGYFIVEQSDAESAGLYLAFLPSEGKLEILAADTTIFPIPVGIIPLANREQLADQFVQNEYILTDIDQFELGIGGVQHFSSDLEQAFRRNRMSERLRSPLEQTNNGLIYAKALQNENKLSSRNAPGTNGGKLACAWAVNRIVRQALGYEIGGGLSTANMDIALRQGRGTRINEAEATPGSIIISPTTFSPRRTGHVGILGKDQKIYSNSSSRALWMQNFTVSSWKRIYRGLEVKFYNVK